MNGKKKKIDRPANDRLRYVRLGDIAILLANVMEGAARPHTVGFEDANHTLGELFQRLGKKRKLAAVTAIESALWSCNLLNEAGMFRHPFGRTFKEFTEDLLHGKSENFDTFYNWIK